LAVAAAEMNNGDLSTTFSASEDFFAFLLPRARAVQRLVMLFRPCRGFL